MPNKQLIYRNSFTLSYREKGGALGEPPQGKASKQHMALPYGWKYPADLATCGLFLFPHQEVFRLARLSIQLIAQQNEYPANPAGNTLDH